MIFKQDSVYDKSHGSFLFSFFYFLLFFYIFLYIYSYTSANEDNSFRNHIR